MSAARLGIAVVGAGMAGRAHAAGYREATTVHDAGLPSIDLVAIAGVNEPCAVETARRLGYRRAESSWQAVANHVHREIVEGLLAAGKHVLCDIPLVPAPEDDRAMVEAAGARPEPHAGVGFTFRCSPAVNAIKEQLDSLAIGAPVHFHGHFFCDDGCDPDAPMNWRYRGGPGTGALADVGSHLADLGEFLCGPVVGVRGATLATHISERVLPVGQVVGHAAAAPSDVREPIGNEGLVTFAASLASGATGTFSASRVAVGWPNSLAFELFAGRGAASFDLARAGEYQFIDASTAAGPTAGYRRVLIGPEHPYVTKGMATDFQGVNPGLPGGQRRPEQPLRVPGQGLPGAGRRPGTAAPGAVLVARAAQRRAAPGGRGLGAVRWGRCQRSRRLFSRSDLRPDFCLGSHR